MVGAASKRRWGRRRIYIADGLSMLCLSTMAASSSAMWPAGRHGTFDNREAMLPPPPYLRTVSPEILDPGKEGSFAKYTLNKRLPAVVERIIQEGAVKGVQEKDALSALAAEIPMKPLERPAEIRADGLCQKHEAARFNNEWASWTDKRKHGSWTEALPLISTEMYFYRRILDCTGFFRPGPTRLIDPYEGQKMDSLRSALRSTAFLSTVESLITSLKQKKYNRRALLRQFILADLWGNQGDLALAPLDAGNANAAHAISHEDSHSNLLQDESEAAIRHILATSPGRIDIILDNSGIELLCDLVLSDFLLSSGLASEVHLHVKGEPLFISDSMIKDVESHINALAMHTNANAQALASNLWGHIEEGRLVVRSHMFWTAPRLFWEMPLSLSQDLSAASLVIVKGDANYRRLVGDRIWPVTTSLAYIVGTWFPAPLLALRTLKAEIAVGLTEEEAAAARAKDKDWMVNGQFAQIQFVGGQAAGIAKMGQVNVG